MAGFAVRRASGHMSDVRRGAAGAAACKRGCIIPGGPSARHAEFCDEFGFTVIDDEIQVRWGRAGRMWARRTRTSPRHDRRVQGHRRQLPVSAAFADGEAADGINSKYRRQHRLAAYVRTAWSRGAVGKSGNPHSPELVRYVPLNDPDQYRSGSAYHKTVNT